MILGVFLMYISSNEDQLTIEDFFMPFGGFYGYQGEALCFFQ